MRTGIEFYPIKALKFGITAEYSNVRNQAAEKRGKKVSGNFYNGTENNK